MDRERRLRKGQQFDSAYSKGTVVGGPLLVLRHIPNEGGPARWGFAVGKRLAKQSVRRNRVKRRLREAARRIPVVAGHDIIVTARAGAMTATYAELLTALVRGLRKAGLLDGGAE
ncbi:MAG: ribonuclease P protein component [Chloroflexi bacterium]|nr:ribonuclease P protein component [Chloroflexota bacterium]